MLARSDVGQPMFVVGSRLNWHSTMRRTNVSIPGAATSWEEMGLEKDILDGVWLATSRLSQSAVDTCHV